MNQKGAVAVGTSRLVVVAAGVTVVLWASAFVAIRGIGSDFSPGALALGRLAVGGLTLGLFCVARRQGWPSRAAWPGIIVSGLLWFGVYMVALNWAEHKVDAGTAAMLVTIGPVLVALLGGWLLREGFPSRLLAGLVIAFAGAAVVGLSMFSGGQSSVIGVALCVLAAVSYAGGVVGQKPALRHASALQVTTFGCAVGAVACLPFAGQLVSQVSSAPASVTLGMVYLGLFPTALAFTTWAYALARTTAGSMGVTTYIVPVVAVLLSWAFLGQVPARLSFVGGAVCLAGVAVTRSKRPLAWRRHPPLMRASPPKTGSSDASQPSQVGGMRTRLTAGEKPKPSTCTGPTTAASRPGWPARLSPFSRHPPA
jgi:drug/metabolite transporter (DMT)-like permease